MRTEREEANDNNAVVIKNLTKVCVEPFVSYINYSHSWIHSRASLMWTPMGQKKVRCPYFRG